MADRYWVGGSGNWDATSTANWSTSSGGTAGASAPTSADNVIFDANSNVSTDPFTVTVTGTSGSPAACNDFTASSLDGVMTLASSLGTDVLEIYGSLSLPSTNFVASTNTGTVKFKATSTGKTITTNGVTFGTGRIEFDGAGGGWTLGSAFTGATATTIAILRGSLVTNNFNVTTNFIQTSGTLTRSLSLGSSTVTLSRGTAWEVSATTGFTFNAGTSTIVLTEAVAAFIGAGLTYHNLTFSGGAGTKTITGANTYTGQFLVSNAAATIFNFNANQNFVGGALIQATNPSLFGIGFTYTGTINFSSVAHGTKSLNNNQTFQNVTVTCPAVDGVTTLSIGPSVTVTGTLTTTDGGSTARRVQIIGFNSIQRTLSVGTNSLINTDFQYISAAGAASWTFGLGYGNLGNNSGITFDNSTLYWIGGTGNWSSTTNWSTSSGGSAANAVPAPQNSVIFDANSNTGTGAFTVTGNPAMFCNDFSTGGAGGALDGAMTLTMGATTVLDCYGSMTLPATNFAFSVTSGAAINFRATTTGKTLTSNGISFGAIAISFDGTGGEWTLGSALTTTVSFFITRGSFVTGNYNITAAGMSSNNSNVRSISLGSSTLTLTGSSGVVNTATTTNLTFNAGTSTITCSATSPTFTGGGITFHNVSFTSAASGIVSITGANTFNNLTFTSRSADGLRFVLLSDNQTVNGTLTLGAANTAVRRISIGSNTIGVQRTITLNGTLAALADVDFLGINAAGTVSTPWTGTRLGNNLGNSNITFDAPKTVYWNLSGSQNWSATGWATTNNGTPAVNNFPLAQDTAVFTEAGAAGTVTINAGWNIGSIQMADGVSNRTTAFTLATGTQTPNIYGNVTLFSNLVLTGTGLLQFAGQGTTQTITSAGVSFTQPITINSPSGTVQLLANTIFSSALTSALTLTAGTLDLNEFNLSIAGRLTYTGTATRSIDFGSAGKIYLTYNGGATFTILNSPIIDNFTIAGTSHIEANGNNTAGARTFSLGSTSGFLTDGSNSPNIYISAGSDTININAFIGTLDFTGFSGTFSNGTASRRIYGNLVLSSTMTFSGGTASFIFDKASGTQTVITNGIVIDAPIQIGATNSPTLQLQDNLTMGSTRTFTLAAGTLNLNSKTLTAGSVSSSNSNTRSINFGTNAVINCEGGWTATTGTGLTTAGRGRIKMSSATDKTFAGGGAVYSGVILDQAGAGTLTLTGANTFDDIQNSNATASQITFPASTVTSVKKFTVSGSSGNLVSLRSSSAGTRFTIQTL